MKADLEFNPKMAHSRQILAGYEMLAEKNILQLNVKRNYKMPKGMVIVKIENKMIVYDTEDKADAFFEKELELCDYYFKRSLIHGKKYSNKIKPLGFNCWVDYSRNNIFGIRFIIEGFLRKVLGKPPYYFHYKNIEYPPIVNNNKKYIIFFTQLYDPKAKDVENDEIAIERQEINNYRIECIKKVKEEFGEKAYVGLYDNKYTREIAPEYIIPKKYTKKENFIKLMQKCNVCICTKGLHNSNGWRLAEYISSSRCIFTENLYHDVVGDFKSNQNYIIFKDSNDLINQIKNLESEKMEKIMIENFKYYNEYLKPDILILNSLKLIKIKL